MIDYSTHSNSSKKNSDEFSWEKFDIDKFLEKTDEAGEILERNRDDKWHERL